MLCFEFYGDSSMSIPLCEETIRYSAHRADGLHLAATVAVTPHRSSQKLYAVHPRELVQARLGGWGLTSGFPYQSLFLDIADGRTAQIDDDHYSIARFKGSDVLADSTPLQVQTIGPDRLPVKNHFDHSPPQTRGQAPFTCLDVGPFPDDRATYLFRLECRLGDQSFADLIPEDAERLTRLYQVYGPAHVHSQVQAVHLPRCRAFLDEGIFADYKHLCEGFGGMARIVPDEYSILAIDNPNSSPARLHCRDLTNDLFDVSHLVREGCYSSHRALAGTRGRPHWFVTRGSSDVFYLQLVGPMSRDDAACKVEKAECQIV